MGKIINLIDYLPESPSGEHKLLPKQELFFQRALDQSSPSKYIMYSGGV